MSSFLQWFDTAGQRNPPAQNSGERIRGESNPEICEIRRPKVSKYGFKCKLFVRAATFDGSAWFAGIGADGAMTPVAGAARLSLGPKRCLTLSSRTNDLNRASNLGVRLKTP